MFKHWFDSFLDVSVCSKEDGNLRQPALFRYISDYLFIENLLRAPFLLSSFTGLSIPSVYKGLNALYTEGNFF